jgi:uncharacterized protein YnzC (UPF0291/DUF896 family)
MIPVLRKHYLESYKEPFRNNVNILVSMAHAAQG